MKLVLQFVKLSNNGQKNSTLQWFQLNCMIYSVALALKFTFITVWLLKNRRQKSSTFVKHSSQMHLLKI